ncbi:LEAF RUST 10 DISEASE-RESISTANCEUS RECEPTOR-LIKE PROTEIN KINASE-like 1.5 [Typha angustifolia]|uniref:LEAF RUST 10 DISEASE-RESISTANCEUS RECEPTOR-LIKE PROTEIN KINASE-like 1.5 n=1 Tax=Typha angustifolia TaxID=59011 RepID=UPI003C2ACC64
MPSPTLYLIALFLFFCSAVTGSHRYPPCSPSLLQTHSPCPPFRSPPSFPFATSPGCGHPSFQIRCSAPHALIFINSTRFLLLDHGNTSLLLSPSSSPSSSSKCPSLPTKPIDFSGSPFRLAANECDRLFSLRSCRSSPANLSSSCSLSIWQMGLLARPGRLLASCSNASTVPSHSHACEGDVSRSIAAFLRKGITVEWYPTSDPYYTKCSSCVGSCGFNDSSAAKPFLCFPSSAHLNRRGGAGDGATRRVLFLTTALFAAAALVLLLLFSFCVAAALRRRQGGGGCAAADPMTVFLRRHHLYPPVFTYDQLHTATGGFDPLRKLGDGGFGSVYLADLGDGRAAAVKRLHRHHPEATSASTVTKSFCNEILILSSLRHPNLVRLHGYCADPRGLLLVYDYVPNGTLADHLHGHRRRCGLAWGVRVDVALQTAAALEYLHFAVKPAVVHRDVTSANIFVEADMRVRLGDFGLSRLLTLPDACSTSASRELVCCTGPQGTPGYLDPEYHRSFRLTEKSDVYSFGVVMLELVTGMRAVDVRRERREMTLVDLVVGKIQAGELAQVVDPVLVVKGKGDAEEAVMSSIEAIAELAFRCVAGDKDDRPDARELVLELKRIRGKLT